MMTYEFSFELPKELIAQSPIKKRDSSRLMVLKRGISIEHKQFEDIVNYIDSGDLLILNDTKVTPCRLFGIDESGREIDILLVENIGPINNNRFSILSKGKYTGHITFSTGLETLDSKLSAEIIDGKEALFKTKGNLRDILWEIGYMPLPPYIKRKPNELDKERYQTVYAKNEGSIAAPTAGIHFTPSIINALTAKGVIIKTITLHVGVGTFRLIKVNDINKHKMLDEYFEIKSDVISEIKDAKKRNNRIILTGTTVTRAIEAYFSGHYTVINETDGLLTAKTDIFIKPGHIFNVPDCLLTNFHLPASTPLILVSAFAGIETILDSYKKAINARYRFFSYGDAMIII